MTATVSSWPTTAPAIEIRKGWQHAVPWTLAGVLALIAGLAIWSLSQVIPFHVALAPCVVGYAEIGRTLMKSPRTLLHGNPYRDWIEVYSGEEFQAAGQAAIEHLERLAAVRMGPGRFERLVQTFRQATALEVSFWDMGLNLQT